MSRQFFLLLFLPLGCSAVYGNPAATSAELKKYRFSEPHLGTLVHLVFYSANEKSAEKLASQCFQRVKALDAILSDYRPDSEVNKLCELMIKKPHRVSEELFSVLNQAQKISALTDGAFDVTLGKHTKRWRARSHDKTIPESDDNYPEINYRDLVLDSENKTVTLNKTLSIDLGGIGKGYIADRLMQRLNEAKIKHAAVIIGGETVLADAPPGKTGWKIGIENPEHQIVGTLNLANTALSTSGDSYQFFESDGKRNSHLIDPVTKKSKLNRLNVTTIAPTSTQADAWATALRILPSQEAIILADKQAALEALFIPFRKTISRTKNFPVLTELQKVNK